MSASTDKAQSDPWGSLYDGIEGFTQGKPPSREDVETAVVAVAVIGGAAPEVVAAIIAVAALVEGLAWIATKLGFGFSHCDNPPSDPSDPQWIHFVDNRAGYGNPIPSGVWSNPQPGSFEAWALPVLIVNWELAANCRPFLDYRELLSRLADAWNASHGVGNATTSNTHDYQLPFPGPAVNPFPAPPWPTGGKIVTGIPVNLPPWQKSVELLFDQSHSLVVTADHDFTINRGNFVYHVGLPPPKPPSPKPQATSTGSNVATGVAAVGGAALVTTLVVAWATGRTVDAVLSRFWSAVKKAARV